MLATPTSRWARQRRKKTSTTKIVECSTQIFVWNVRDTVRRCRCCYRRRAIAAQANQFCVDEKFTQNEIKNFLFRKSFRARIFPFTSRKWVWHQSTLLGKTYDESIWCMVCWWRCHRRPCRRRRLRRWSRNMVSVVFVLFFYEFFSRRCCCFWRYQQ